MKKWQFFWRQKTIPARRPYQHKPQGKYYRTNHNLPPGEYRVVGSKGENLGVMSKEAAISKALEEGLDLVEIASQAKPPVARIVEFQKFRYEESKKEQAAKKNAKEVELKEIWLTPRIAEHDLQTRLRRVEEFLADNNKVMFRVKFKGREMAHIDQGFTLINRIIGMMGDKLAIEREAKREGRNITVIVGKNRGTKVESRQPQPAAA